MYPILLKSAPVSIVTNGCSLARAFLCGIGVASREAKRLGVRVEQNYQPCFWIIVAALIGSRFLHILRSLSYLLDNRLEILICDGYLS